MQFYGLNQVPDDQILVYEVDTDPLSLDPACCVDYIGQLIIQSLYQPMFIREAETGAWQLGAAEHFEVSSDGLTYTFYLQRDKYWSDGMPVVANDFVFALRRLLDPATNSPHQVNLYPLLNAEEISDCILPMDELGVTAIDKMTLQVKFAYPISYHEALFGMFSASPMPSHIKEDESLFNVFNGPFTFREHVKGNYVLVYANPFYGGISKQSVMAIKFNINKDMKATLEAYRKNQVQITCNTYFPFERIADAENYDDFYREPSSVLFLLQINTKRHEIFRNRKVRKMLYEEIEKDQISLRLHGGVIPWDHFIPKGLLTEQLNLEAGQVGNRRDEIEEGLLKDLLELPTLTVLFAEYFPNREVLELIQEMWVKKFGFEVILEGVDFAELVRRGREEDYDLCLRLLAPSYSEPLGSFLYYLPDLDDGVDDLFIKHLETAVEDVEQRSTAYLEANCLLQEELPAFPLLNGHSLYFVSPALRGYRMFPDGSVCFQNMTWAPIIE